MCATVSTFQVFNILNYVQVKVTFIWIRPELSGQLFCAEPEMPLNCLQYSTTIRWVAV